LKQQEMPSQMMSITQALAELKLLDKRLSKQLNNPVWVDVSTVSKPVDAERMKERATSEYQSFLALVTRRDTIKRAIVLSNATTRVTIDKWEGTVAEAIEHKKSIQYKQNLLDVMKGQLVQARVNYEAQKSSVDSRLERLLQSELGKDVKTNPETITALSTSFRNNNKVELVDPLDLASKIAALESEIDSFETNVDWVLSEANGRTMISV
jgi:hypothetical protein